MKTQEQLNSELQLASIQGDFDEIKFLVAQGADIHANENHALCMSAWRAHLEIVKYFVEHGADIHANKNYALRLSSLGGHLEIVKYLVENGAEVDAAKGYSLHWSLMQGHVEVAKYLASKGADISNLPLTDQQTLQSYIANQNISTNQPFPLTPMKAESWSYIGENKSELKEKVAQALVFENKCYLTSEQVFDKLPKSNITLEDLRSYRKGEIELTALLNKV